MHNQDEINYFGDQFSSSEKNDIPNYNNLDDKNNQEHNNNPSNNNYISKQKFVRENNNIHNNNLLYQNSFNNKSYRNNTNKNLSFSFGSSSNSNLGNSNSFSNNSYSNIINSINNSINSFNLNIHFPSSFQNKNTSGSNSFNNNLNNTGKYFSDIKIKYNLKVTKKTLLEMPPKILLNYLITQKGSREAQNIINKTKENEVDILLTSIFPFFSEIIMDKYGNYFSKKLIQICLPSQRIKILKNLENNFIVIAKSIHGTHPLQFLIETINMEEEKYLVIKYIVNNSLELALDQRGNSVLKKIIICTNEEERKELNNNLIKNIDKLIINQYGVIILISLIKHSKSKIIYKNIADYITFNNPIYFIRHPYSNYVIQALLLYTDLEFCDEIIKIITNNYLYLSLNKHTNKVVENCIKHGKNSVTKKIFKNLIEKNNLEFLLGNCYGNFVLEKLLFKLNKDEKKLIKKKLEEIGKINEINDTIKILLNNYESIFI